MRIALHALALAALLAGPALATNPGPPDGQDVQTKAGPPIAPGAAAGENKLLPAVRPPNPNRGLGVPPPDPDKGAGAAAGENKLLPAVQAPGADVQIQPGPPQIGGGNLPAVQAPSPADIGSDRYARPPPQNMPGGIGGMGGMGAAGFKH